MEQLNVRMRPRTYGYLQRLVRLSGLTMQDYMDRLVGAEVVRDQTALLEQFDKEIRTLAQDRAGTIMDAASPEQFTIPYPAE